MRRTHLPLNALRVFDAAARHLSFTKAADELAVTPAAVGQQIRALEDVLGVILFRRASKGLELTSEGEAGLDALREGFLRFEEAVSEMQSGQGSAKLTIAAPRDFTVLWLLPRIAAYRAENPDLEVRLLVSDGETDFTESNIDLAIWYAEGHGAHEGVELGPPDMVELSLPDMTTDGAIRWPGGPVAKEQAAVRVADAGLAIEAAAAGLGTATVPRLLAATLSADTPLVQGREIADPRRYWLVAPLPQWRQKKVKALVEALTAEA